MFCFKCGASMPDTSPACPQCGTPVSAAPPAPVTAHAAAPAPAQAWPNARQTQPIVGQQETDGKAVGSLILGILAIFPLGLFAGIPAVILGHVAQSSIRKSMGRLKGQGMATAGLVMGYISIAFIPLILIIAAIAIPNLIRAKIAANESVAASTLRTINTAQITYTTKYPNAGFAHDLATLGPGSAGTCAGEGNEQHACLLDALVGCTGSAWCTRAGYSYNMTAADCAPTGGCGGYVVVAAPIADNMGRKRFCSTADAVIRSQYGGPMANPPTAEECQSWLPVSN